VAGVRRRAGSGPRLTFAEERAQAAEGIYVSPPQPPQRPATDLQAWGADGGKAAIEGAARERGFRRRTTNKE